jgi:hypothetical protein
VLGGARRINSRAGFSFYDHRDCSSPALADVHRHMKVPYPDSRIMALHTLTTSDSLLVCTGTVRCPSFSLQVYADKA